MRSAWTRMSLSADDLWTGLAVLVPGALTAYFATQSGGYFAGAVGLAAVELALILALRLGLARRPLEGVSVPLMVAVACLAGLAVWILHSQEWSHSPVRAMIEYDRVLMYGLALALFGTLSYSARRTRWMLIGLAAALVGICAVAMISRTLPDVIYYRSEVHPDRLGFPVSYWNTLGILSAITIVLCGHLACSVTEKWPVRVLAAASVPLVTLTLYYTFSRGGTWTAIAGVVVYVIVGRPRGILSGAIATAPPTAIALLAASPATKLTTGNPLNNPAYDAGHEIALILAAMMVAAAVLRVLTLPLDRWARDVRLPAKARRPVLAGATACLAAVSLAGCAAVGVPGIIRDKYEEFNNDTPVYGSGSNRFLESGDNGRREHWDVALDAFRRDRLHGSGAGTYGIEWHQHRKGRNEAQDGHSLYLETLGELGWPGLVLVGIPLLLILGALAFRARGPDRTVFAALLAAATAWALHAGLDWDWEQPVVTLWLFAFGGAALARQPRAERPVRPVVSIPLRVAGAGACLLLALAPLAMARSQAKVSSSLDKVHHGDCQGAILDAREAAQIVPDRAAPYDVIGYCLKRQGRPRQALAALDKGVERDPRNWELLFARSVAKALSGEDPRADARRAWRLNPNSPLAERNSALFRTLPRRAWRRYARQTLFFPPGPPTP